MPMGLLLLLALTALGYAETRRAEAVTGVLVLTGIGVAANIMDVWQPSQSLCGAGKECFVTPFLAIYLIATNLLSATIWFWVGRGVRWWRTRRDARQS